MQLYQNSSTPTLLKTIKTLKESRQHMKPTDYTTILSKLTNEFPTVNPTLIDETLHEAVSTLLERKHIKMEPDNE